MWYECAGVLDGFVELASFLPHVAARVPHKAAMVWRGTVTTYAELDSGTSRLAGSLEAAGFVRGDRIGALMENSPEMVGVWLATLRAGCVFVPFNTALRGEMLGYQLHNSGVRLLFVDSSLLGNLEGLSLEGVRVVVNKVGEGLMGFGAEGGPTHVPVRVDRSDPAVVLYTSGTTGSPKGVVLPHYAFINRVMEIEGIVHLRGDDVLYNSLPLYHTSGQVMTTLPALLNGLTVVQQERFHASTFWSLAASSGATVSFLLNRMVNILLNTRDRFERNALRVVMCGGVRKDTLQMFEGVFGVRLLEGFGMTETCGIALYNTLDEDKEGSVGKALPSVEAKLSGGGSEGELMLRPKIPSTMFTGYLGEDPIHWERGEWFNTGDILSVDAEGFYYYVERKKDLIRSRGENIAPTTIESAVEGFPGVVECAAVGVPSGLGDEDILVAIKSTMEVKPLELMAYLSQRLPYYMLPRYLLFVDEIPKTPTQKLRREAVRRLGLNGAIDVSELGFHVRRPS